MSGIPKLIYLPQSLPRHIPVKYFMQFIQQMSLEWERPTDMLGKTTTTTTTRWKERVWDYQNCYSIIMCLVCDILPFHQKELLKSQVLNKMCACPSPHQHAYPLDCQLRSSPFRSFLICKTYGKRYLGSITQTVTLTQSQAYGLTRSYVLVEPIPVERVNNHRDSEICEPRDLFKNNLLKSLIQTFGQYMAVLTTKALAVHVLGSPRAPLQQFQLLSDIIKIFGLGHESSQYYSNNFCQANTLPTTLKTIWEKYLNFSFSECEN